MPTHSAVRRVRFATAARQMPHDQSPHRSVRFWVMTHLPRLLRHAADPARPVAERRAWLLLVALLLMMFPVPGGGPGGRTRPSSCPPGSWRPGSIRRRNGPPPITSRRSARLPGENLSMGGLWLNVNEPKDNILHQLDQVWAAGATPFVNIHVDWPPGSHPGRIPRHRHRQLRERRSGSWLAAGEGRAVLLAPMPEMNGDWVPYGMDPANFPARLSPFSHCRSPGRRRGKGALGVRPNGWSTPPHTDGGLLPRGRRRRHGGPLRLQLGIGPDRIPLDLCPGDTVCTPSTRPGVSPARSRS